MIKNLTLMDENNLHNMIKNSPEDFIVDEIPIDFQRKPDGKYTIDAKILCGYTFFILSSGKGYSLSAYSH